LEWREWEEQRVEGRISFEEKKDWELQREENWMKIRERRFSKWYVWIKKEEIPRYLDKGWGENRWRRVARFRLGNEMREGRY